MNQIDIGVVYTVAITYAIVIAITWFNIVAFDKAQSNFFRFFAKINAFFVSISAIYVIMFSYEAFNNSQNFLSEKGSYDKYAIAFCIYYGAIQIAMLIIYKLIRFIGRNRRMIKK